MGVRKHQRHISPGIAALVQDWGGFEQFVGKLHDTGDVRVSVQESLEGRAGTWIVDVVVRSRVGLHEHLTIIECKYWTKPVGREAITNIKACRDDVNASKAVLFTAIGVQQGAEEFAKSHGIDVYVVRDLMPDEWGAPGKDIFLYLLFGAKSLGPMTVIADPRLPPPTPLKVDEARLARRDGSDAGALRERLELLAAQRWDELITKHVSLGEEEVTIYVRVPNKVSFADPPWQLVQDGVRIPLWGLHCDLLFELVQTKYELDRSQGFDYTIAVVDMLRNTRHFASRRPGEPTQLAPIGFPDETPPQPTLENGSRIRMLVSGFQSYPEMLEKSQHHRTVDLQDVTAAHGAGVPPV